MCGMNSRAREINELMALLTFIINQEHSRLDDYVGNESLETLYWLKWGFVIMIIGYIYSQKCNENAKKKRLIYFELWKLWKHSFVYILKKKLPEFEM